MRDVNTTPVAFPTAVPRALIGLSELAIAEAVDGNATRPEKVTQVLTTVYETIASKPATVDFVRRLPSATREWLLQRAAQLFRPDLLWFEAVCTHCQQPYDLSMDLAAAAQKTPESMHPVVEVETSLGTRSFYIPNGAHEEAFARDGSGRDPRRILAAFCGLADQADDDALQFDENDLERIDQALEAASPEIADEVQTNCPSCNLSTTARIEPLLFAFPKESGILQEIHLIAKAYGWVHDQILELPSRRRAQLAGLIMSDHRAGRRRS